MKKLLLHGFNSEINKLLKAKYATIWIADDPSADIEYIKIRDYVIQDGDEEVKNDIVKHVSTFSSIIYECYSRHHYMKTWNAPTVQYYHRLMIAHIKWAQNLLKKHSPEFLVFSNVAHEGYDNVLAIVARFLNFKIYFFYQTPFAPRFWIYEFSYNEELVAFKNESCSESDCDSFVRDYIAQLKHDKPFSYMQSVEQNYRFKFPSFVKSILLLRIKELMRKIFLSVKYSRYNRRMNELVSKRGCLSQKYGYFALHLQPELSTSALGYGIYFDQLTAVRAFVSECRKRGLIAIVKDNPKQNFSHRDTNFFDEVSQVKNVIVVDRFNKSIELVKHAEIIGTVTGTVGLEALAHGVPVIVYGDAWYKNFSGVFHGELGDDRSLPKIDFEDFRAELLASCTNAFDGCVDSDYFSEFGVNQEHNDEKITYAISCLVSENL